MALLLELQRVRAATAAVLAARLEVSERTIYRDVAALQAAGVPLWTEPGPGGGIRLVDGWRTELDGLTGDEAAALFLAGAPGAVGELGLGTVLVAAQTKVLATLPPELRGRARRVQERFHLDAPGWFHHDEPLRWLGAVAASVWDARRLEVDYGRPGSTVQRRLDPLGLVLKAGTWYLVARHRGEPRTYRVSRIQRATALDERFDRPDGFDLAAWWAVASAAFDRSILRTTIVVRLSPKGQRLLPAVTDSAAAREALASGSDPDGEGWRTVELAVEGEDVALDQLVALGDGVEIVSPPSLRERLAAVARAMAQRNR
jgi:predicted DNA-binding transcriptional regulator YafY